jgi:hypothetical protein
VPEEPGGDGQSFLVLTHAAGLPHHTLPARAHATAGNVFALHVAYDATHPATLVSAEHLKLEAPLVNTLHKGVVTEIDASKLDIERTTPDAKGILSVKAIFTKYTPFHDGLKVISCLFVTGLNTDVWENV